MTEMPRIDAVEINALLDVIIKAKDSPGFAAVHQAALARLMEIVRELTPEPEPVEEKPPQWQPPPSEGMERRV